MVGYNLSVQQKRAWLLSAKCSSGWNIWTLRISGPINVSSFKKALESVTNSHEIMCSRFTVSDELAYPLQELTQRPPFNFVFVDLSGLSENVSKQRLGQVYSDLRAKSCCHPEAYLFCLIKISDTHHKLVAGVHPLSLDSHSFMQLLHDLVASYYRSDSEPHRNGNSIQYVQYAEWQKEVMSSLTAEQLARINDDFRLADWKRYRVKEHLDEKRTHGHKHVQMAGGLVTLIEGQAMERKISTEEFLLTCWSVFLARHHNDNEVVMGLVEGAREDAQLERVLGRFSKILPIRLEVGVNDSLARLQSEIGSIRDSLLEGLPYFNYGMAGVDANEIAYLPVGFECLNCRFPNANDSDVSFFVEDLENDIDAFELKLSVVQNTGLILAYDKEVYQETDIEEMAGQFVLFLKEAVVKYDLPLDSFSALRALGEKSSAREDANAFWLRHVRGAVPFHFFRNEQLNPNSSQERASIVIPVAEPVCKELVKVSTGAPLSIFLLLLVSLRILKYRYQLRDNALIVTSDFRLEGFDSDRNVVYYLPSGLKGDERVIDLLTEGSEQMEIAKKNGHYDMNIFHAEVHNDEAISKQALQSVAFTLEGFSVGIENATFDIHFNVIRRDAVFHLEVSYLTHRYNVSNVVQLGSHFNNILRHILKDREATARSVKLDEHTHLAAVHASDGFASPGSKPLHVLFEEQVRKNSSNTALVAGGHSVSYKALNEMANALASYLRNQVRIENADRCGIMLDRSVDAITAVLAILKCGACYVPIDHALPEERKKFIIQNSEITCLLTSSTVASDIFDHTRTLHLDTLLNTLPPVENNLDVAADDGSLAYIIYTSGSTGMPKGCMLTHWNVGNYVSWAMNYYLGDGVCTTFGWFTPLSFDFTVTPIFCALLSGKCLVILKSDLSIDDVLKYNFNCDSPIDIVKLTPSHIDLLAHCRITSTNVKRVIVGGEALTRNHISILRKISGDLDIINEYGPTEATVGCIVKKVGDSPGKVAIGKPIHGMRAYILDQDLNFCPTGVMGEIFISGAGLSPGYYGDPGLTKAKFLKNPYLPDTLMYRSGDLAYQLDNGDLMFEGRNDDQVKINGYRVELGEIENALLQISRIVNATVLFDPCPEGSEKLTAYIVTLEPIAKNEIREILEKTLQMYMIPARFVRVDKLPLTSNGKIDRKLLSKMEGEEILEGDKETPCSDIEGFLMGIWQEVLKRKDINVNDNFFALGGDSIKAIRIVNRVQETLQEILHITMLFRAPTIRKLAREIAKKRNITDGKITLADVSRLRKTIDQSLQPPLAPRFRNKPAVFILSPPRSGSTLLRVILAGSSKLFSPPEMELLTYNTLQERQETLQNEFSFYLEGVIRAMMELNSVSAGRAKEIMRAYCDDKLTVQEFYRELQKMLNGKVLVEKSPSYSMEPQTLEKMEANFEDARYIHLVRNPYATIASFEEANLQQVFRFPHSFTRRQLAELVWYISHDNILQFLATVPANRQIRMKYEDLVTEPSAHLKEICKFLDLPFDEEMVNVYDNASHRMVDGPHPSSRMIGDPKFSQYNSIHTSSLNSWKERYPADFLCDESKALSTRLGYEFEAGASPLLKTAKPDLYDATHAQERIWVFQQVKENKVAYNQAHAYQIMGDLDIVAFERSFRFVIGRHESLRTNFVMVNEKLKQKVRKPEDTNFAFERIDFRLERFPYQAAKNMAESEANTLFDLSNDNLLRARIMEVGDCEFILLFTLHHIISDGWSLKVLVDELLTCYEKIARGQQPDLPELGIQFKDYSEWLNGQLSSEGLNAHRAYWRRVFGDKVPILNLPLDFPRPKVNTYRGDRLHLVIEPDQYRKLRKFSEQQDLSLFTTLSSVVAIILYKYSGQKDFVIGTSSSGRTHKNLESQIGLYLNTFPLRFTFEPEDTIAAMMQKIKQSVIGGMEHQVYPVDMLIDDLKLKREFTRHPLFDVQILLQNINIEGKTISDLKSISIKEFKRSFSVSRSDFVFDFSDQGDTLGVLLKYNSDLFAHSTVDNLGINIVALISDLVEGKINRVADFKWIADASEENEAKDFEASMLQI